MGIGSLSQRVQPRSCSGQSRPKERRTSSSGERSFPAIEPPSLNSSCSSDVSCGRGPWVWRARRAAWAQVFPRFRATHSCAAAQLPSSKQPRGRHHSAAQMRNQTFGVTGVVRQGPRVSHCVLALVFSSSIDGRSFRRAWSCSASRLMASAKRQCKWHFSWHGCGRKQWTSTMGASMRLPLTHLLFAQGL